MQNRNGVEFRREKRFGNRRFIKMKVWDEIKVSNVYLEYFHNRTFHFISLGKYVAGEKDLTGYKSEGMICYQ